MVVTTQARQQADRIMFAIRTRNKKKLAEELTFLYETITACAVVRVEREFVVKPRKVEGTCSSGSGSTSSAKKRSGSRTTR